MNAQTEYGFKEIDITKDFDNPFMFFNTPLLLMAGDSTSSNAMTIGWGNRQFMGYEKKCYDCLCG